MYNLEEIKREFITVIKNSQGIDNPKVDALFDYWYEAKKEFITAMGDELIYELPDLVSFNLTEQEKTIKLNEFISNLESDYGQYALSNFIYDMHDCFYENIASHDYVIPNTEKVVKKGTKIIKDFKYFISDKTLLTTLQDAASQIIQQDKIEGKICISVHPLDYLSLSENNHKWRSCHSLDGEFRAGNLDYMTDKSTIICYLKSEKDEVLRYFSEPWNNKKWRVLLFFSEDREMLFAGRQYPFEIQQALDFILTTLLPKSGFCKSHENWTPWHSEKIKDLTFNKDYISYPASFHFHDAYYPVGDELIKETDLINDNNALHFNDLLHSSCYDPVYSFKIKGNIFYSALTGNTGSNTRFYIGGPVKCLKCEEHYLHESSLMVCDRCDNSKDYYCEQCGCLLETDADIFLVGDQVLCYDCYQDAVNPICENCLNSFPKNEIYFDDKTERFLCKNCLNEVK